VAAKSAPKKASAAKAAARRPAPSSASTGKSRRAPRKITAKQALANTRKLLEAKHAHDRQPPPWQAFDGQHNPAPPSGQQSGEAQARAEELHAAESRMEAIQGTIGSLDRHNQGKRDQR
jgi:hypothetical protein